MVAEARLFVRLGLLSFAGFVFYYAHLFFGVMDNVVMFKALAQIEKDSEATTCL